LDHLDLLLADRGEHGGEFGLLLGWSSSGSAAGSGSHGHRGGGGGAPLLLQPFREGGGLKHRQFGKVLDEALQISPWASLCGRTSRACDACHAASPLAASA